MIIVGFLAIVVIAIVVMALIIYLRRKDSGIDIVYSWIDGDNPIVKSEIMKWREIENPIGEAGTSNRFKTMDELRYSLRSVKLYAPWVRNIYIITSHGIVPPWFDEDIAAQNNIYFVDDSTLLPKVPVFNSLAKESVKHKIPGLSEQYLYLNDDFFFGNHVTLKDFVSPSGKAYMFLEENTGISHTLPVDRDDYFANGMYFTRNTLLELDILNINSDYAAFKENPFAQDVLRRFCKPYLDDMKLKKHAPHLHFVSEDNLKWEALPEIMKRTSEGRFRAVKQLYDNTLFDNYWKLCRAKGIPGDISYIYIYLTADHRKMNKLYEDIKHIKPKVFCVNDGIKMENDTTLKSINGLSTFLDDYFPKSAPWEIF
tara:strand:- start:19660 stop:20769 length:1110 start_codon:yes stop_codon:yes gene_type:complete